MLRKVSLLAIDNETGECIFELDADSIEFNVENKPHFIESCWTAKSIHTHTMVDGAVNFENVSVNFNKKLLRNFILDHNLY